MAEQSQGDEVDLFIIGGGINGAGIARDAAGRGLTVALAERDDLAGGTSWASSKLVHGGLRYLEHYKFRLVREALAEREVLLRIAPHLVRPLRFVMPYQPALRPAWMIRLGLFLYDRLGGRSSLPGSEGVDLASQWGAGLKSIFRRGFAYSDCRVDDSRLVILNARDAARNGARIMTRTACVAARRDGTRWQITTEDRRSGARHDFRARARASKPICCRAPMGASSSSSPSRSASRSSARPRLPSTAYPARWTSRRRRRSICAASSPVFSSAASMTPTSCGAMPACGRSITTARRIPRR